MYILLKHTKRDNSYKKWTILSMKVTENNKFQHSQRSMSIQQGWMYVNHIYSPSLDLHGPLWVSKHLIIFRAYFCVCLSSRDFFIFCTRVIDFCSFFVLPIFWCFSFPCVCTFNLIKTFFLVSQVLDKNLNSSPISNYLLILPPFELLLSGSRLSSWFIDYYLLHWSYFILQHI